MLTDCSIQTEEPDEALDFNFTSADVVNKIIMKVYISNKTILYIKIDCKPSLVEQDLWVKFHIIPEMMSHRLLVSKI